MRKYLFMFFVALVLLATNVFAQTDSLDVFTCRAPEAFSRSEVQSGLQFELKARDGNFCTITLYKSRPAKKDVMKDIASQWNEQVAKRLSKADKKPAKILTGKTWDGWVSTLAIGNFYRNKKKCVVMLNSFERNQTSAFVIFTFSDPLFKRAVEDFSQNLHLKDL